MQQRRRTRVSSAKVLAVRFAVVVATTGVLGAVTAPAQADTGWNLRIGQTVTARP